MSDSSPAGAARPNLPEYTVSELSGALKRSIEGEFGFVRVRGELGPVKRHTSGHVYVDMKDDKAVLAAVVWRGTRLAVAPEQGLEVIASGRLTTFAGQSKYQLVIEQLEMAGRGAIMKLLEERRKKLAAEGLFAPERKKPLPFLPRVIGVVTSPTGAVIRDILHRLADRFPRHVLIWPVAVQGERAAAEVVAAIAGFNALAPGGPVPRPDVLIVARGGGSFEDLMPFSEESVVRAAAASAIPLISAVGHETDTTLIDFAADRRAPTPTAAAEMAVPVRAELILRTRTLSERMTATALRDGQQRRQRLRDLARALARPEDLLGTPRQRLDNAAGRLGAALRDGLGRLKLTLAHAGGRITPRLAGQGVALGRTRLEAQAVRLAGALVRSLADRRRELGAAAKLIETMGHKATLARGFALVRGRDGTLKHRAGEIRPGEALRLDMADGAVAVTAEGPMAPPQTARAAGKPARRRPAARKDQGNLF